MAEEVRQIQESDATYLLGKVYSGCKEERFAGTDITKFTEGARRGDLRYIDMLISIYESKNSDRAEYWKARFREEVSKVCYYEWSGKIGPSDIES